MLTGSSADADVTIAHSSFAGPAHGGAIRFGSPGVMGEEHSLLSRKRPGRPVEKAELYRIPGAMQAENPDFALGQSAADASCKRKMSQSRHASRRPPPFLTQPWRGARGSARTERSRALREHDFTALAGACVEAIQYLLHADAVIGRCGRLPLLPDASQELLLG